MTTTTEPLTLQEYAGLSEPDEASVTELVRGPSPAHLQDAALLDASLDLAHG
jgi:hypothetical protein